MKVKLTRRQFGQLAIASTAVVGLGYFSRRTVAQTPQTQTIYGLRVDRPAGGLVLQSLNLATKTIQENLAIIPIQFGKELVNSLNYLAANTFLVIISPIAAKKNENDSPRLVTVVLGQSPISVPISGLKNEETLQSLEITSDGSVIGLVHKKDKKSARVVSVDVKTGVIDGKDKIKPSEEVRYDNLAKLNGRIYTTSLGLQGDTNLVELELEKGQVIPKGQLKKEDGAVWNSGFRSLTPGSGNQLYALGAPRYVTLNSVYSINVDSGVINELQQWDVVEITAPPA
jgi:hypothetical protein